MKKWIEDNAWWMIIIMIVGNGLTLALTFIYLDAVDDEETIVEGIITKVEYLGESKHYLDSDILKITFDNGDSYVVECSEDIDFTVNSKMIVKLWRDDSGVNWEIKRIYKVPENP